MLVKEGGRYNTPLQEFIGPDPNGLIPREVFENPEDWMLDYGSGYQDIDLSDFTDPEPVNCGKALFLELSSNNLFYINIENHISDSNPELVGMIIVNIQQIGDSNIDTLYYLLKKYYNDGGSNSGGGGSV